LFLAPLIHFIVLPALFFKPLIAEPRELLLIRLMPLSAPLKIFLSLCWLSLHLFVQRAVRCCVLG
jgi:hypothetical protein